MSIRILRKKFYTAIVAIQAFGIVSFASTSADQFPLAISNDQNNVAYKFVELSGVTELSVSRVLRKSKSVARNSRDFQLLFNDRAGIRTVRAAFKTKSGYVDFRFLESSPGTFSLQEISNRSFRRFYADAELGAEANYGSSEAFNSSPPRSSCTSNQPAIELNAAISQIQNQQLPEIAGECGPERQRIERALSDFKSLSDKSPLNCQARFTSFADGAMRIRGWLSKPSTMTLSCEKGVRSNFDEKSGAITFGSEIVEPSSQKKQSAYIYHELLHASGVKSESENDAVVKCCMHGDKHSCEMTMLFDQFEAVRSLSPKLGDFVDQFSDSRSSNKAKSELLRGLKLPGDEEVSAEAYVERVRSAVSKSCLSLKRTPEQCDTLSSSIAAELRVSPIGGRKYTVLYSRAGELIGNVPANSEAVPGPSQSLAGANSKTKSKLNSHASNKNEKQLPTQILAEEPRYTPGGASSEDMKRDAQRYSGTMAKVAEQAQSYERTIAANVGWGIANAAPINLPVSDGNGTSSTSLKEFNPSTGETTLNAINAQGQAITIKSAPVSFDGSPMSLEIRNASGAVVARTGLYKTQAGLAELRRAPPNLSADVTAATGSTIPARYANSEVSAIARGDGSNLAPQVSASGGEPRIGGGGSMALASSGSSTQVMKPVSTQSSPANLSVKQMVMRAPYEDHERMKSLYERVKAADYKFYERPEENPSVTFRYCGVNYPANFQGKNFVNLDVPNAGKMHVCAAHGRLDE